jgi:hypothetical protein
MCGSRAAGLRRRLPPTRMLEVHEMLPQATLPIDLPAGHAQPGKEIQSSLTLAAGGDVHRVPRQSRVRRPCSLSPGLRSSRPHTRSKTPASATHTLVRRVAAQAELVPGRPPGPECIARCGSVTT